MNESLSWCRTDRRLNQWAPALLALFLSSPMPPAAADPLRTPKSEARVLMEEGVRHYQQHVAEAALAELDHAELLGDQTPDLFAARIPLLCQAALGPKKAERGQEDEPLPDDGPIDERVRLILRAIADDDRYQRDNLEAGLEIFDDSGTMEGRSYELR
ncbi:MAG TPA: hypothetical protein VGO11_15905, partial [Chthoniobacteraceae bacterium]|nr:hypothetical protein [Chthoniobacteraceae bacterium]